MLIKNTYEDEMLLVSLEHFFSQTGLVKDHNSTTINRRPHITRKANVIRQRDARDYPVRSGDGNYGNMEA